MATLPQIDYILLLPHILLAGSAIIVLLVDMFLPPDRKSFNQLVSLLLLGLTLFLTLNYLWANPRSAGMLNGERHQT